MSLRGCLYRKNVLKLIAAACVILAVSLCVQMILIARISKNFELGESTKETEVVGGRKPVSSATLTNTLIYAKPTNTFNFTDETKSALKRAKSESCRNKIKHVASRLAQGNLFPSSLPHFCPKAEIVSYGCYVDAVNRFLVGPLYELPKTNSVQSCIAKCFRLGFKYAGVEYGIECRCSNKLRKNRIPVNITECHYKCPANESEFCGGKWRILVFSTGVKEINRTFAKPRHTSSQTNNSTYNEPTNDIRIVFHFLLCGRLLRQVLRLLKHMYSPRHYYFFHIDKREEYLFRELGPLEHQVDNIKFKKKRFASIWGGTSHLTEMLESIREMFEVYSHWKWDFVLNLSESHFPLFPISDLEAFLSANRRWNFALDAYVDGNKFISSNGYEWTFLECDNHLWRLARRKLIGNVRVMSGSHWFAYNKEFLHYITYSDDELVKGLKLYYEHTAIAPESFYQTLLANSRFCQTYAGIHLQMESWQKSGNACGCKKEVDWCGCSPVAITTERATNFNYDSLRRDHKFVARKFDSTADLGAINIVERHLLNRTYNGKFSASIYEETSYKSFWFNDFHYLDKNTETDPAKLTLLHNLLLISINQPAMRRFKIVAAAVEELTILLYDGQEFLLLKYSANTSTSETIQFETQFQYKPSVAAPNIDTRVTTTEVGTNWDIKIGNFRNYAKSFGSTSTLGLRVVTNCTEKLHLKSIWYHPNRIEQGVVVRNTTNKTNIWLIDWSVNKYLTPGLWSVDLHVDGILITQLTFPVLPNKMTKDLTYRTGEEIDKLSNDLVTSFYAILDNCIVDNTKTKTNRLIQTCRNAQWSSLSPDPKSSFSIVSPIHW